MFITDLLMIKTRQEFGNAEYFITCDNDIIKKATKHKDIIKLEVCTPLEFILKEIFKNA